MKHVSLIVMMSILLVMAACGDSTQEKPEVFDTLVAYENADVEIVQYLGPTTDEAELEAFIAWLESEGFEETNGELDFSFYGFAVTRSFESDDQVLGLNILLGEETTILTTLIKDRGFTFENLPDGYPEHGQMFVDSVITEALFIPTYPPAITQYIPEVGDPDLARFHMYHTTAEQDALYDYFTMVLEAEGFEIEYDNFEADEGYFYLEASRDDIWIHIVVDDYGEGYRVVEVDESVGFHH